MDWNKANFKKISQRKAELERWNARSESTDPRARPKATAKKSTKPRRRKKSG